MMSGHGIHTHTGDAVNTFVPLDKLEKMDRDELKDFYEIWLTTSETWPQDPERSERECLWRADRELTQDVEIDEAYFQNLPRLWLVVDDLNDLDAVGGIENKLGSIFRAWTGKVNFALLENLTVPAETKITT